MVNPLQRYCHSYTCSDWLDKWFYILHLDQSADSSRVNFLTFCKLAIWSMDLADHISSCDKILSRSQVDTCDYNHEMRGRISSMVWRIHSDSCKDILQELTDSPPFNLCVLHFLFKESIWFFQTLLARIFARMDSWILVEILPQVNGELCGIHDHARIWGPHRSGLLSGCFWHIQFSKSEIE